MNHVLIKNLSKSFTVKGEKKNILVLNDINLEISKGSIIGLTGENGSGKTTLLKIIAGIIQPTSGEVSIEGRAMGLFDIPGMLNPYLTVKESVHLWCSFSGLNKKEIEERYDDIIAFAELEEFKNAHPKQFSTGMIARLVISSGLHCEPDIMLLDESLSSIDAGFKKKAMGRVKELVSKGAIAILVSHDEEVIKNNTTKNITLTKSSPS